MFPISARTGKGVGPLLEHLVSLAPEGPFLFPLEEVSDQPEHVRLAELVREQVLHRTRQEVPHAVEVQVDEILEREDDGLVTVRALLWVETESQKGIVIGSHGKMIKAIGTAARQGARARARPEGAPRPVRAGAPELARRRRAARPARDQLAAARSSWSSPQYSRSPTASVGTPKTPRARAASVAARRRSLRSCCADPRLHPLRVEPAAPRRLEHLRELARGRVPR